MDEKEIRQFIEEHEDIFEDYFKELKERKAIQRAKDIIAEMPNVILTYRGIDLTNFTKQELIKLIGYLQRSKGYDVY